MRKSLNLFVRKVGYEVPDFLINRDTAESRGRKSLDAIEGEGKNYERITISILTSSGEQISATTYIAIKRHYDIKTSAAYTQYILDGIIEHNLPNDYRRYVLAQIIKNNRELEMRIFVDKKRM